MLRSSLGLAFVLLTAGSALAERPRLEIRIGPDQPILERAIVGHTIYLNRCIGGCNIVPGTDDATSDPISSQIVDSAAMLAEYDQFGPGEWEQTVQCVKEIYSPFAVTVTDVRPPAGASYSSILVGGTNAQPGDIAIGVPGAGGVASATGNCSPIIKGVSYAFTDQMDSFGDGGPGDCSAGELCSRARGLCWIIGQETAHTFGLDHEFEFVDDKRSSCSDPMTYRSDCGGQKFYRNKFAVCGEFPGDGMSPRPCRCGANQNSHLKLLNTFGAGTSLIGPPTVSVTTPAASSTNANSMPANIIGISGSKRGVNRVELWLNNYKWGEVNGAPFGRAGQLNPSSYSILPPLAQLPDSIYDIEFRSFDDLEIEGRSAIVSVVKGPAGGCASADTCLKGQKCEAGKCFWDPPSGAIGDPCEFPQFCVSERCEAPGGAGEAICTQNCVVGVVDSCPADSGLVCIATGGGGVCGFADDGGGCCSASDGGTPWAPFGFAGLVLGFVVFRRRR